MKQTSKKVSISFDEVNRLSILASSGDKAAREELILSHLFLVEALTFQYLQPGLEWDDLYQEGCLGLIQAVDKYDYKRRVSLSTYATYWIKKRLKKASFTQNKNMPLYPKEALFYNVCRYRCAYDYLYQKLERNPTHAELAAKTGQSVEQIKFISEHLYQTISFQEILSTGESNKPSTLEEILIPTSELCQSAENQAFRNMASFDPKEWGVCLTNRERLVLNHHLGFIPSGNPESFSHIASISGWGIETVRQDYLSALSKLRSIYQVEQPTETDSSQPNLELASTK